MPMKVANPQSATRPAARLARLSPAANNLASSIIDFPSNTLQRSTRPQPATLMVFNGQQIPPKCPFPSAKVHQKGKRPSSSPPPGIPPCQISEPCVKPSRRYRLQNILQTNTQTVNDIGPTPHCLSALCGNLINVQHTGMQMQNVHRACLQCN